MRIREYFERLLHDTPDNANAIEYEHNWWTWGKSRTTVTLNALQPVTRLIEDIQRLDIKILIGSKWGELVKATVVLVPKATVEAAELINWTKERIGTVFAPKAIDFVNSIPTTENGKHDKSVLRTSHSR
ncbi:hypothetical protein XBJ2_1710013 [Xenorhabdus bovienii str. Jollieti]|uniref:AMP-binding enzyme C-terminal domain-containing protein n=1 Tax=Xenorhabdus bovienii (strain SS-2004) TaxID=406818 RepID=D3V443_XENBS|nr:hypothetical protein [Xenorhabdus bovienii]CBJ82422.1 hypothetical protein XBJ1_3304 [Xenorhabdus bovienii SS-2004]CDH28258.1 hypothetical protein XBJ2_1710013 [Xenorhabdus bovienii str. Jollieti]